VEWERTIMSSSWHAQLEQLLEIPIQSKILSKPAWQEETAHVEDQEPSMRAGQQINLPGGEVRFIVRADSRQVEYVAFDRGTLTEKEMRFVSFILQQMLPDAKGAAYVAGNELERSFIELGAWIQEQLEQGSMQAAVPDSCSLRGRLNNDMIPFYIVTDQVPRASGLQELKKLLDSFFEEDIVLAPLKEQEWLVLTPDSLLHEDIGEYRGDEHEESPEDILSNISMGLYDMLASEWIGECHIAVSHPTVPLTAAVETVALLRETVMLGRKFHMSDNIHLPWNIHLERLLNSIPESQRIRYMEQVINRTDLLLESEIVTTLETFFEMNCNVSDTAKKLFIHRNTLLYRLDKLKQDTGLDVRLFRDAVLVKIILLLYKVTKRK
jgi:hypothetical protein